MATEATQIAANAASALAGRRPATRLALVGPAEERERRAQEDLQVDARAPVPDVPEVELDPLGPRQRRAPVDLGPARDPRQDVEPVELPLVVAVDLVAERRPRADHGHLAADDVPELRQLVERELAQHPPDARDPRVAAVDREAGADLLRADDHRPQLQQLEVDAVLADAHLLVEDRPAVLELHRERGGGEQWARDGEAEAGDRDVERAVQRVPSATSHVAGTPRRR